MSRVTGAPSLLRTIDCSSSHRLPPSISKLDLELSLTVGCGPGPCADSSLADPYGAPTRAGDRDQSCVGAEAGDREEPRGCGTEEDVMESERAITWRNERRFTTIEVVPLSPALSANDEEPKIS